MRKRERERLMKRGKEPMPNDQGVHLSCRCVKLHLIYTNTTTPPPYTHTHTHASFPNSTQICFSYCLLCPYNSVIHPSIIHLSSTHPYSVLLRNRSWPPSSYCSDTPPPPLPPTHLFFLSLPPSVLLLSRCPAPIFQTPSLLSFPSASRRLGPCEPG